MTFDMIPIMHWRGKRECVSLGLFAALIFLFGALLHYSLADRLPYPPTSDQTMYLAGGEWCANQFIFLSRSPLYAAWMGLFYLLSGHNLSLCFHLEKFVSLVALSIPVALLGRNLLNAPSGLLMGLWVLNCKYLIMETNGSHTLAAALFAISLNCLFLRNKVARLPTALLVLFFSTQVRSEMWVVFLFVVAFLVGLQLKMKWFGWERMALLGAGARHYWGRNVVIGMCLILLFNVRQSPEEPHRFSEAFAMNFALNYIDRHHLSRSTPPGDNWAKVWAEALPDVSISADAVLRDRAEIHVFTALTKHPKEILKHVLYNMKLASVALPAVFLAFDRRALMICILVAYVLWLLRFTPAISVADRWKALPRESKQLLLIWSFAILLLLPISLVLRVVARYYIQLIPIQVGAATTVIMVAVNKCKASFSS